MRGVAGESQYIKLIINARVETTPAKLDLIIRQALDTLTNGKYKTDILAWKFLQPGRPQPTHRFAEIVA